MRKVAIVVMELMVLAFMGACTRSYEATLTGNVTSIILGEASETQNSGAVVTFIITDNGISVDSIVEVRNFHRGAEADATYMIRNESSVPVAPIIYFRKGSRVDDYSMVEGQGFKDAPSYVDEWITISPKPSPIPVKSAQNYIVALSMPNDVADDFPKKFGFVMAVATENGKLVQLTVGSWWLVSLR